jgi:hypothetical protein
MCTVINAEVHILPACRFTYPAGQWPARDVPISGLHQIDVDLMRVTNLQLPQTCAKSGANLSQTCLNQPSNSTE